jgi:hypothetical protein
LCGWRANGERRTKSEPAGAKSGKNAAIPAVSQCSLALEGDFR